MTVVARYTSHRGDVMTQRLVDYLTHRDSHKWRHKHRFASYRCTVAHDSCSCASVARGFALEVRAAGFVQCLCCCFILGIPRHHLTARTRVLQLRGKAVRVHEDTNMCLQLLARAHICRQQFKKQIR